MNYSRVWAKMAEKFTRNPRKPDLVRIQRLSAANKHLKMWMRGWLTTAVEWPDGDKAATVLAEELQAALRGKPPSKSWYKCRTWRKRSK